MGSVQSTIVNAAFTFCDDGKEKNKQRLFKTYRDYKLLKIDVFSEVVVLANTDDFLSEFNEKHNLAWPDNETEFLDGYMNALTEDQAIELSAYFAEKLPPFA